jgi:hypothetical protein
MPTISTEQRLYGALRKLRRLAVLAAELQRTVSSTELKIDSLVRNLTEVVNELRDLLGIDAGSSGAARGGRGRRVPSQRRKSRGDEAGPRAISIEMIEGTGGASHIRIEGGKSVRLAPRLSAFLRILAADEPYGDGPLVGWKSKSEVARRMEKQFGLQFHPHTLDTLTYRLRSALESIGEPPGLVHADRRWGMRFALQRGGLTVTQRLAS